MPAERTAARRCAILAGGLGRRLGGSKAMVELAGRPLISYPIAAAVEAGLEPLVVAKPSTPLADAGVEVLIEPEEPTHPLIGIAEALASVAEPIVVCPCDVPLVPAALLRRLAARPEPLVVVEAGGRMQPLIGRYVPSLEAKLRAAAAAGKSTIGTISELGAQVVGETELEKLGDPSFLVLNVNTPADLERATAALSG